MAVDFIWPRGGRRDDLAGAGALEHAQDAALDHERQHRHDEAEEPALGAPRPILLIAPPPRARPGRAVSSTLAALADDARRATVLADPLRRPSAAARRRRRAPRRRRASTIRSSGPQARARSAGLSRPTTSTISTALRRASLVASRGGSGLGPPAETEIRAADATLAHQCGDDPARRAVDRDGEPEPDAGDCGVDPYDAAGAFRQRAAGVSGVERGVRLDDALDDPGRGASGASARSPRRRPRSRSSREPCGFPIATTSWPTRSVPASPSSAGSRRVPSNPVAPVRSTARSDSGSVRRPRSRARDRPRRRRPPSRLVRRRART